jgi:hypothetical protein
MHSPHDPGAAGLILTVVISVRCVARSYAFDAGRGETTPDGTL